MAATIPPAARTATRSSDAVASTGAMYSATSTSRPLKVRSVTARQRPDPCSELTVVGRGATLDRDWAGGALGVAPPAAWGDARVWT